MRRRPKSVQAFSKLENRKKLEKKYGNARFKNTNGRSKSKSKNRGESNMRKRAWNQFVVKEY